MICKFCGKEFVSIFSEVCPYCLTDNSGGSIFGAMFSNSNPDKKEKKVKDKFDPYDWDNPDNCSDREYMDDDDYDDFDHS